MIKNLIYSILFYIIAIVFLVINLASTSQGATMKLVFFVMAGLDALIGSFFLYLYFKGRKEKNNKKEETENK